MTKWIRYDWADDDTVNYLEIGDDGRPSRQVTLEGPLRLPVSAASLEEVLHIRDQGTPAEMATYERRYGVMVEGDVHDRQDTEITQAEFDRRWAAARQALFGRG
ncbi:hypothetical protein [Amycolatopsis sp. lyj-112]|uniref:hypothetical protein n=1 Tax=Amycolatopsis sp. lyj-112 TaxID=2789288 RepID=UPI003977E721